MKTYLCILLTICLLTSCSPGEPRYIAQFMLGLRPEKEVTLTSLEWQQ